MHLVGYLYEEHGTVYITTTNILPLEAKCIQFIIAEVIEVIEVKVDRLHK
jgi:hypothetical protein